MKRLATSLGTLIAVLAIASAAEAGSYSFSIGGHRFHIESPRNCRSASCVSVSSRSLRQTEDVNATSAAPPAVAPPQPAYPAALVPPPQATVARPSPAPVLAATASQPVAPPRLDPPKIVTLDPPRLEPPSFPSPEVKPATALAQRNDDEPAYLPLGEWESAGARGTVRIERCGPALCGYALTEAAGRGESVLVNMKPKSHDVWNGSIYSRSSGNTYYATMTLKSSGRLHVEACALGRFWCTGNDWTRIEVPRERMMTTSRQWSARL